VPDRVSALAARGGRPDLAGDALHKVIAPTLLIVGGRDAQVMELNQRAFEIILAQKNLEIVRGATHLSKNHELTVNVFFLTCSAIGTDLSAELPLDLAVDGAVSG